MTEYPQIGVRVDEDFLKLIDEWRRKQDDVPTRPEAIRRLVELGLTMNATQINPGRAERAAATAVARAPPGLGAFSHVDAPHRILLARLDRRYLSPAEIGLAKFPIRFMLCPYHRAARGASIGDEIASCAPAQVVQGAMIKRRRRFKQITSLKDRLTAWADGLRNRAHQLAPGPERDAMLKKARQADTRAHLDEWAKSPELRPPT
jgi:hypothetical protein